MRNQNQTCVYCERKLKKEEKYVCRKCKPEQSPENITLGHILQCCRDKTCVYCEQKLNKNEKHACRKCKPKESAENIILGRVMNSCRSNYQYN